MKRARNKQLMFEDYLGFFDNPNAGVLTMDHLNMILSMNGFCRRKVKREVMDDLRELEMMSPKRSTLNHRAAVYPCAPLTVDEVKADIRSIGWEECPIGSILAVGSAVENETSSSGAVGSAVENETSSSGSLSRPISTTTASSAAAAAAQLRKKKGSKRNKRAKTVTITALVPV